MYSKLCKYVLIGLLLAFSPLYAQSSWQPAFTLLDDIEQQLRQLQDTNSDLLKLNGNLEASLLSIANNVDELRQITIKQDELLNQWEENWNGMTELYAEQSRQLANSERTCKILKICIPITAVVSIAGTAALLWRISK